MTDPTPVEVVQSDRDLARLCVSSALIFAEYAEHIEDARNRAAEHIARHRLAHSAPPAEVGRLIQAGDYAISRWADVAAAKFVRDVPEALGEWEAAKRSALTPEPRP